MIVPNKTVVTFEGRVYGPGEYVPDPKKEKIVDETIDEVIDRVWDGKSKVKCKK